MFLKSFLARIFQGYRTGTFPTKTGPKLPSGFRGRPVLAAGMTEADLAVAAAACPCEGCLAMRNGVASLDMGRCTFCGRCAAACSKITFSREYRLGVFRREDLIVRAGEGEYAPPKNPNAAAVKLLKRSFQIREVSAGGCAACELDFNVLGTLAWDLGRFGMKVVASPRHADAVYVTGPVSRNMSLALEKTYDAMGEPKFVIAAGACAISGGLYAGSRDVFGGAGEVLPEPDLFIPGCPPHPATTLEALLRFCKPLLVVAVAFAVTLTGTFAGEPVDSVNCFIGTGGDGHCFPAATYPFGLVQAGPDTGWGTWEYCSGYRYEDGQITMFSQTHNPGGGCPDYADVGIMPFVGESGTNVVSTFSHANETASPGYYAVTLDRGGIRVEVSATERASIYRVTPGRAGELKLLVDLDYGMGNLTWAKKTVKPIKVERTENGGVRAHLLRNGFVKNRNVGVELRFSVLPKSVEELPKEAGVHAPKYVFSFELPADVPLLVKCGLSVTDGEGAARNLEREIPDWDFHAVRIAARAKWNEVLSRATVSDSDPNKTAMFMTAVYRMFHTPTNIADVDGRYRGGDGQIATTANGRYYSEFSLWDTFRGAHPFFTLAAPEYVADFVNSMIAHQKSVGFLPVLPKWGQDSQCMIATHAVAVIVEAWRKGFGGVDWKAAYEAIRATLRESHPARRKEQWDLLDRYGYYPCDRLKGEGVSRTLECSYDDWCAAEMARTFGSSDDVTFFEKRAQNWTNVFDRVTGFMRGRETSGRWREPFDPYHCGHETSWAGDFTEGNAWQWRWHVLQDPAGLVSALGGRQRAAALLDELFSLPPDLDRTQTSRDVTGLLGQYVQGNEPSHHIPYLYQYAGRPDRAAERVRQLCETFYFNRPDGLCGNEDHGEMSAWYVFACLGFYPVNPASGEFIIGAPQVEKAVISLGTTPGRRKTFVVLAKGLSKANRYVKSVRLNGRLVDGFVLTYADIAAGGELVFEMVPTPAE